MSSETILVLDGEHRASLAVCRSLGKKGLRVISASEKSPSLAGASRYVRESFQYTSPYISQDTFIRDISEIVKREKVDILIPVTDVSMYSVLQNSHILSPIVQLPLPSFDQYISASNKILLIRTAHELNIPAPKTLFFEGRSSFKGNIGDLLFPVVLKPQSSNIIHNGRIAHSGVKIVNTMDDLIKTIYKVDSFNHPFMIQEKILGEGIGVFALFNKGEPVTFFSHRRIREKPPWGGVSVLSESTPLDQKAKYFATEFLKRFKWHGVAMVEFKRDIYTNVPLIMEINARFWGSLQLAIDSGVDFPYFLYLMSQNRQVPYIENYLPVRLRWLLGDLDNLIIAFKTEKNKLPREYHNRLRVALAFLVEFFRNSKFEVLRKDDPGPFLLELKDYIKSLVRSS